MIIIIYNKIKNKIINKMKGVNTTELFEKDKARLDEYPPEDCVICFDSFPGLFYFLFTITNKKNK